jgi:hypothetical protein
VARPALENGEYGGPLGMHGGRVPARPGVPGQGRRWESAQAPRATRDLTLASVPFLLGAGGRTLVGQHPEQPELVAKPGQHDRRGTANSCRTCSVMPVLDHRRCSSDVASLALPPQANRRRVSFGARTGWAGGVWRLSARPADKLGTLHAPRSSIERRRKPAGFVQSAGSTCLERRRWTLILISAQLARPINATAPRMPRPRAEPLAGNRIVGISRPAGVPPSRRRVPPSHYCVYRPVSATEQRPPLTHRRPSGSPPRYRARINVDEVSLPVSTDATALLGTTDASTWSLAQRLCAVVLPRVPTTFLTSRRSTERAGT